MYIQLFWILSNVLRLSYKANNARYFYSCNNPHPICMGVSALIIKVIDRWGRKMHFYRFFANQPVRTLASLLGKQNWDIRSDIENTLIRHKAGNWFYFESYIKIEQMLSLGYEAGNCFSVYLVKSIRDREAFYSLLQEFQVRHGEFKLLPQKVRRGRWHRSNVRFLLALESEYLIWRVCQCMKK